MTIKVTLDGTALEGATVLLSEISGGKSAVGITDARGVARIKSTEGKEGVFPGEYAVTIKKTETITSSTPPRGMDVGRDVPPEDQIFSTTRELLPAKYGSLATSGLTVTQVNKKGAFEFDLTENP